MKSELRLQLLHSRMRLLHSLESFRCGPFLIPREFLRVFRASGGVVAVVVVNAEDAATRHAYILGLAVIVVVGIIFITEDVKPTRRLMPSGQRL